MYSIDIYIKENSKFKFLLACADRNIKQLFIGITSKNEFLKILNNPIFKHPNSVNTWPWSWNCSNKSDDVIIWIDDDIPSWKIWKSKTGNCWIKDPSKNYTDSENTLLIANINNILKNDNSESDILKDDSMIIKLPKMQIKN